MIMGVPYDAEIAYLESTGTQYILLPLPQRTKIAFECEASYSKIGDYDLFGFRKKGMIFQMLPNYSLGTGIGTILDIPDSIGTYRRITTSTTNAPSANTLHRWEYNGATFKIDGVTIGSYSNVFIDATPYLGVFCRYNDGSNPYAFISAKIASLRFYNDMSLMFDLIPVRVGQVGYMYDRVTRKLFGNAGTGAFVLGPDVARPVMGLRKFTPTARNYVQDGLVALWDGIENAGWGVHNPNATVWKDLVGGNDITLSSQWSFGVSSVSRQYGYLLDAGALLSTASNSFNLSQFSIECVCARTRGYSDTIGGIGIRVNRVSFAGIYGKTTLRFDLYDSSGSRKLNYIRASSDTTIPHTIGFVYDGTSARCLTDGMQYAETPLNMNPVESIDFGIIYSYAASESSCIRICSRALSADEIAANYAIDKIRFNLP